MASPVDMPGSTVSLRSRLLAAALGLCVAAVLCEGIARLFFVAPPDPTRVPPVLYQNIEGVGFVHAPNQKAWIDDGLVTTNSFGLRGAEPVRPKPAGTARLVALGDSTTLGWGVNDADTYPVQLETRLQAGADSRAWDVINAGISGYDLHREARLLAHLAPRLQPDVVLVGLFWNDLPYERMTPEGVELQAESSSVSAAGPVALPAPAEEGPETTAAPVFTGQPFRVYGGPSGMSRVLRSSRLAYVLGQVWYGLVPPTGGASNQLRWEAALLEGLQSEAIDAAWRDIEASLADIREIGRAYGFVVGVVIMPVRAQVEGDYPSEQYQTRAKAIAGSLGLFAIDPLDRFRQAGDRSDLFIPYDRMHYSARGNRILADAVFDALQSRLPFDGVAAH